MAVAARESEDAVASHGRINNHAAFIWSVADLLRGDYKQSEYGRVILPFTVLRRLDCVLEATKAAVLQKYRSLESTGIQNLDPILQSVSGQQFYNVAPLTFGRVPRTSNSDGKSNATAGILDDPTHVAENVRAYVAAFSEAARDILENFGFDAQITRLDKANLLYGVVGKFAAIDLHPDAVSNVEMGYLYEELIRRFSELSNETAGEHFTPREVIRLMVNLLFIEDEDVLRTKGAIRTMFDTAAGTGGMLSVSEDYLRDLNPDAALNVYGEELNPETYAICRSDMMLKGQDASHIRRGNSFSEDRFEGDHFDYMLANPPFGVEWKKVEAPIRAEGETKGFDGRFGAGLPRINDGSFLFLQHMISKMKPVEQGGTRLAIVFNGSPLFTGGAGSGESEIRRWIIENDWLEAVVALPDQLFYNTGISTYFWILTNRKSDERKGKVQLVDGREFWVKMRKSLGNKRKEISAQQIEEITRLYGDFAENDKVKIFRNESLGFMRITTERPLRVRWEVTDETVAMVEAQKPIQKLTDEERAILLAGLRDRRGLSAATEGEMSDALGSITGNVERPARSAILSALTVRDDAASVLTDKKGRPLPDPELRDYENVPLPQVPLTYEVDVNSRLSSLPYRTAVDDYTKAEVLPYVPDAWVDHDKTKIGYEIPLTRYFYRYVPPRPLEEIDAEIRELESRIQDLLREAAI